MSSPGCPYDNAAMENFFGTLKTECLYRAHFTTRAEVEQLVTEYVLMLFIIQKRVAVFKVKCCHSFLKLQPLLQKAAQ